MTTSFSTCTNCSESFSYEPVMVLGRQIFGPRYCDPCCEKLSHEEEQMALKKRKDASKTRWNLMIPPIYHDTDISRIPKEITAVTEFWQHNPKGIGINGRSGKGKTRATIALLHRMHEEKRNTYYITATDLALNSANQFADNPSTKEIAKSILSLCRHACVLLLDDLGKNRMTDRAEAELYDLLEYRTSHRLPIIWTSNSDARGLLAMFSPDRGDAIVRRLAEFSTIIKV